MKKTIKSLSQNPLISGSFFVVSGGLVANFFNFLFNLLMSRNLRIEDYGALISLVSIITLLSIPVNAINPMVISIAGAYYAKGDNKGIKTFYIKILKPLMFIGIFIALLSLIFSQQISLFLKIDSFTLILISALCVVSSYIGTHNLAFLQAGLSFRTNSTIAAISAFFKVLLGFVAIIAGWSLIGGLSAYLAGFVVMVILSLFVLRKILFASYEKLPNLSYREFFKFGVPSTIAILALNSYISTDIILVKHLFSPQEAGLYAGISLVGRIIFYLTAPIATVMFPLIVQRYNKKENYKNILFLSIALVFVPSLLINWFYYLFPEFTILFVLKNPSYLQGVSFIGLFGLFATVYSILSLLVYYNLSINKTSISYFLGAGAVAQAILIYIYHNSIYDVIMISIAITSLLLIGVLLYYFINKDNNDP